MSLLVCTVPSARGQSVPAENASVVSKVEPPNWWIGLTPEVMLLLSGRNLEATRVSCNLPAVTVSHTQSSANGNYLFVWLEISKQAKPGTVVCRISTPNGSNASFELPLSARTQSLGKFRGISEDDVIYLIMPDRFANGDPRNDDPKEPPGTFDRSKSRAYHGGDLAGIRQHLDYLQDLGVTALWLTPVVKNYGAQSYHGYGAVDFYAVEPHLGTLQEYQDLVVEAHRRHMKILFDVVPNHVGPNHPWVLDPPAPEWFHGTLQNHGNTTAPFAGSFYGKPDTQRIADPFETLVDPHAPPNLWRNLTTGWFAGILPDMNTENPLVAQYLLQNSIWWTQSSGLDGFRVDTFPYVPRRFWEGWHAGLRGVYPNLTTLGEVFHPDPSVTSFFVGGQKRFDGIDSGLSTVFDYPLYFALRDVLLKSAPVGRITDVLRHDSLYMHPDSLITFFGNHDVTRFANEVGGSPGKIKLAFGLTLTLRGIPQLYYGDEIALAGGGDPENRRDFPGGWVDDSKNAFTEAGRNAQQQEIFSYVQSLLRIRREHLALRSGALWDLYADDSSFVFVRVSDEDRILVAFNNSAQARELQIPVRNTPVQDALEFSLLSGKGNAVRFRGNIKITMPPLSVSIFSLN